LLQRAISSDVKIIGADLDAANGNSFPAARRCAIFGVVGGRIATGDLTRFIQCPLLALSGHPIGNLGCLLSGVKADMIMALRNVRS
jgi:hypothetical protein